MQRAALIAVVALAVVAGAAAAHAEELRVETRDWVLTAPSEIGTQADLELTARAAQICTDEVTKLVGHRPRNVAKFEMRWTPGAVSGAGATSTGVINWYRPGFTLLDDVTRAWREDLVARGICFGPHEIAHVLTWQSWGQAWANEGFATFTDSLYDSLAWRCCDAPTRSKLRCDASGYTWALERYAFSDLSPFTPRDTASYNSAACFWWEVHRVGGFPAIRAILASMRGERPRTTGEFAVRHVNPILGADLRPLLGTLGFEPGELEAAPRRLPPALCTRIGTAGRDILSGTRGRDVLCGLGGADLFRTRDGNADSIRCGPGKDAVVADRRDRVAADCERVSRR
jgi:hypothetical protein